MCTADSKHRRRYIRSRAGSISIHSGSAVEMTHHGPHGPGQVFVCTFSARLSPFQPAPLHTISQSRLIHTVSSFPPVKVRPLRNDSVDDHKHHSRQSRVLNATGRMMSSAEIRGIPNSSPLALRAPHGAPLKIVRNSRAGNYVVVPGGR